MSHLVLLAISTFAFSSLYLIRVLLFCIYYSTSPPNVRCGTHTRCEMIVIIKLISIPITSRSYLSWQGGENTCDLFLYKISST